MLRIHSTEELLGLKEVIVKNVRQLSDRRKLSLSCLENHIFVLAVVIKPTVYMITVGSKSKIFLILLGRHIETKSDDKWHKSD